jgi:hypothetical protein
MSKILKRSILNKLFKMKQNRIAILTWKNAKKKLINNHRNSETRARFSTTAPRLRTYKKPKPNPNKPQPLANERQAQAERNRLEMEIRETRAEIEAISVELVALDAERLQREDERLLLVFLWNYVFKKHLLKLVNNKIM